MRTKRLPKATNMVPNYFCPMGSRYDERSKTQDAWIISFLFLIISYTIVIVGFDYYDLSTGIIPNYMWWIISGVSLLLCYKILVRFYVQNQPESHFNLTNYDIDLPLNYNNIKFLSKGTMLNYAFTSFVLFSTFYSSNFIQTEFEWLFSQSLDDFITEGFAWVAIILAYLSLNIIVISIFYIPLLMIFADTVDSESDSFSKISNQNLSDLLSQHISNKEKITFLKQYSASNFEWGVKVIATKFKMTWHRLLSTEASSWILILIYVVLIWILGLDAYNVFYWTSFIYIMYIPTFVHNVHISHGEMVIEKMIINRCAELIGEELEVLIEEE